MLGDFCSSCGGPCTCSHSDCGCSNSEADCGCGGSPCLPGPENAECSDWVRAECVFWMGDAIPGTPIKKGVRLTEIVTYLLARIADHEARLTAGNL